MTKRARSWPVVQGVASGVGIWIGLALGENATWVSAAPYALAAALVLTLTAFALATYRGDR